MGHRITEALAPAIGLADIPVYKTAPLTLDGDLRKPVWQRAERVPICYEYLTENREASPEATAYYMVAWDERFLYIAYDWSSDAHPITASSGEISGTHDNRRKMVLLNGMKQLDCFEFFVDMNYDEYHFWELHHNDRNDFSDIFCIRPQNADDKLRLTLSHPGFPRCCSGTATFAMTGSLSSRRRCVRKSMTRGSMRDTRPNCGCHSWACMSIRRDAGRTAMISRGIASVCSARSPVAASNRFTSTA